MTLFHIKERECPDCGWQVPPKTVVHEVEASGLKILSGENFFYDEVHEVTGGTYAQHKKRGADDKHPKTLRVTYEIGPFDDFKEWICIEHKSYFHQMKTDQWWKPRSYMDNPKNAFVAAKMGEEGHIVAPTHITIRHKAGSN